MYPDFTNVSRTSVPGMLSLHCAAISGTSPKTICIVLSLKHSTNLNYTLAAELLRAIAATALVILSPIIVIISRPRQGPSLPFFPIRSLSRINPLSIYSFLYTNFISYFPSISCSTSFIRICLLCKFVSNTCLMYELKHSYGLQSKPESDSNLDISSNMWSRKWYFRK